MNVIEFHYGCNVRPTECVGPWDNFYTVFGSRLEHLAWHILVALLIGFIFGSVLMKLKRKEKFNAPFSFIIIIQIIVTIVSFFTLTYTMPSGVFYP